MDQIQKNLLSEIAGWYSLQGDTDLSGAEGNWQGISHVLRLCKTGKCL